MAEPDRVASFEQLVLPHLRAGYNLARWILRNDHDADDVLQEAMLRAYRSFDAIRGANAKTWWMAVVRNRSYNFLRQNRSRELNEELDDDAQPAAVSAIRSPETPEVVLLRSAEARLLNDAVLALPVDYREVFVLRELEGLSYKEIADLVGVPIGTVMSRLFRARRRLQTALVERERDGSGA